MNSEKLRKKIFGNTTPTLSDLALLDFVTKKIKKLEEQIKTISSSNDKSKDQVIQIPTECVCDSGGVDNTTGKCITCGLPYKKDSWSTLKSKELNLKDTYKTGKYMAVFKSTIKNKWILSHDYEVNFRLSNDETKLIHIKDKEILDACLLDTTTDIEVYYDDEHDLFDFGWKKVFNFIETYNEKNKYRFKPQDNKIKIDTAIRNIELAMKPSDNTYVYLSTALRILKDINE